MYNISHFSFHEFLKSNPTVSKVLEELPKDFEDIERLLHLASIVETFRRTLGNPIFINSGFRSKSYNARVGGVPTSFHCKCSAVDIRANDLESLRDIILAYCGFSRDKGIILKDRIHFEDERFEVILYPTFIHFAYKYELPK